MPPRYAERGFSREEQTVLGSTSVGKQDKCVSVRRTVTPRAERVYPKSSLFSGGAVKQGYMPAKAEGWPRFRNLGER